MRSLNRLATWVDAVGLGATLRYRVAKAHDALVKKKWLAPSREPVRIRVKGYQHPVWMREGSADPYAFFQLFVEKEHDFNVGLDPDEVRLIVDCGANVGYTSVFMLNKYPNARLIAVEPDPENLEICRRNLEPYGARAEVIRAGVWSHETHLKLVRPDVSDFSWRIMVKEVAEGESSDLFATSLSAILERSGCTTIDLLKIDVEGSEEVIFAKNTEWLDHVRTIGIELHGPLRREIFFRAMSDYRYDLSTSGEVTVCSGIAPISKIEVAMEQPMKG
jgi:FkbM family methyltransferase